MTFFSNGEDKYRLVALYILRRFNTPISHEQLVTVMVENGMENFFDVSSGILDLEENGYIASVPTITMQMVILTKKGEETIALFDKTLPKSLREALDEYVDSHIGEYKMANTSRVVVEPVPDGGVKAVFAIIEGGESIFEIRIMLPDIKVAQTAEKNWDRVNEELYVHVLQQLIKNN